MAIDWKFYKNKRVFLTGHTGFKGAWLTQILLEAGAKVWGYALEPNTIPSIYQLCELNTKIEKSVIADIRDYPRLKTEIEDANPDIIIHLAAQPLVLESYQSPRETYEVNVMGTVNLLDIIRTMKNPPRSVLNVTTDKVYLNREWVWSYREDEILNGFDPYSNSKSCSELITSSYINSFAKIWQDAGIAISTARSGNVIGGGDFADNRIIPDCVRAATENKSIEIRNPNSTRPYQHVLETLFAYLLIIEKQFIDPDLADCYNIGPNDCDCLTTGNLVDLFCKHWQNGLNWENKCVGNFHEANFLKLDCSKIRARLSWQPNWDIDKAIQETVSWHKVHLSNGNIAEEIKRQITEFYGGK